MKYSKAARTLRGMGMYVGAYKLSNETLPFVDTRIASDEVILDGEFTADQLEAIAMWMRKPNEVTNA